VAYSAEIIADSISPDGVRLTTFETEWPHAVHKDFMTHTFPKNFESFRAQPPEKVLERVKTDPFVPKVFYKRAPGMNHGEPFEDQAEARGLYLEALNYSIHIAEAMLAMNMSKDQVNFILQDYSFIRGVVTATEWDHFFGLRADPENTRPEVREVARMMRDSHAAATPKRLDYGEWHLPFTEDRDTDFWEWWLQVSTGRTARISYASHRGTRDQADDARLHDDLLGNGHMSPTGHQATPIPPSGEHKYIWRYIGDKKFKFNGPDWSGALYGWAQYRKSILYEENYRELRTHAKS
jgi:hypothetical protein